MTELEKVIRGLRDIDMFIAGRLEHEKAKNFLRTIDETIALLKEQEGTINELQNAYGYLQKQFFEAQEKLLKEQETGRWIYLENCSNSGVYCSECHTKVFDNYPFKKKFSYFCPHCGTRMEGETERR